jgi:hypothetical protein
MSTTTTSAHPEWDTLVDYWLGDTDAAATEAIDEHLMHCDACGTTFDEVVSLSRGVNDAFARGALLTMLSAPFVERLKAAGRRVREYRVPLNGTVTCSVAPDDDLLVSRLAAPLRGVARLDAVFMVSLTPGHEERLHDIPFDAANGEVLFAPRLAEVRRQPTHELVVRLLVVDAAGERELGRYTFHHQAVG